MCHSSCIEFARNCLFPADVTNKSIIEVGSLNVNGSVRPIIAALQPSKYIGVDIQPGPGVDCICDANNLVTQFGEDSFDLVISTELLEHVQDWRSAISNIKRIAKPDGLVLITTRSITFPYHGYPFDFWRYQLNDMEFIFEDFIIEILANDYELPGVFLRAKKPTEFVEKDLAGYPLYSMITETPTA